MYMFRTEALRAALAERPAATSLQQARAEPVREAVCRFVLAVDLRSSCSLCKGTSLALMVRQRLCEQVKRQGCALLAVRMSTAPGDLDARP